VEILESVNIYASMFKSIPRGNDRSGSAVIKKLGRKTIMAKGRRIYSRWNFV